MSIESFKVIFVGETEVGKTSILTQFTEKTFSKDIQTTTSGIYYLKYGTQPEKKGSVI